MACRDVNRKLLGVEADIDEYAGRAGAMLMNRATRTGRHAVRLDGSEAGSERAQRIAVPLCVLDPPRVRLRSSDCLASAVHVQGFDLERTTAFWELITMG